VPRVPRLLRCFIMPALIPRPTRIESAGNMPKVIEECVGRVSTATAGVSVVRMRSPEGWEEPGQTPEFDEYTVVLRGTLGSSINPANWMSRPGKPSSRTAANGSATRHHFRAAPSI
jgi:hypothetical protein